MYPNRVTAAGALGDALEAAGWDPSVVVGLAPNGIPVALTLADSMDAAVDTVVVERVPAPGRPEAVIGAVTADGQWWANTALIQFLDLDWSEVEAARRRATDVVTAQAVDYGRTWGLLDVADADVLVVDDGIGTGAAMHVALERLAREDPASLTAAAPVGAADAVRNLERAADEVLTLTQPDNLEAIANHYATYRPVSHAEATERLAPPSADRTAQRLDPTDLQD